MSFNTILNSLYFKYCFISKWRKLSTLWALDIYIFLDLIKDWILILICNMYLKLYFIVDLLSTKCLERASKNFNIYNVLGLFLVCIDFSYLFMHFEFGCRLIVQIVTRAMAYR